MSLLRLRRPSPDTLQRIATTLDQAELSYPEVGATVDGTLPRGYHHHRSQIDLEPGDGVFERAREALRAWTPHLGSGIAVSAGARVAEGETVAVAAPLPGAGHVVAVCRVVYVIDEPGRFGFAYGTIAGHHPESGEELFVIETDDEGHVAFGLVAFSRPGHPLTRVVGPLAPWLQAQASRRYLVAMRDAVVS